MSICSSIVDKYEIRIIFFPVESSPATDAYAGRDLDDTPTFDLAIIYEDIAAGLAFTTRTIYGLSKN